MLNGHLVIDADSHKCENPVVFLDYIDPAFRGRLKFIRDRYGEQRFVFVDFNRATGRNDLERVYLQPEGYGKGTFRPYHDESTIGGIFNRLRVEHMDREGVDAGVIYGSIPLGYGSIQDPELAVALCRAFNDYILDDCRPYANRLFPVAVLPLQDPRAAVAEMRRCVEELGMVGVTVPPNIPQPHPDAPERFPAIRVPKPLSHPDFAPIFAEAERLDVAIGIHGAIGMYLAGGNADQVDTFTVGHVLANRGMHQTAMATMIFDGFFERYPKLRVGFLEAGCGWMPDFLHTMHEHWEKRVVGLDLALEPNPAAFLMELAREKNPRGGHDLVKKSKNLLSMVFSKSEKEASAEEKAEFVNEHPHLARDPRQYVERGQIYLTFEPDDPSPAYLEAAMGTAGRRLACFAIDYGHWDATLKDCVRFVAENPAIRGDFARQLLLDNALRFYGPRLRSRLKLGA
ncbi:MAG: amidohydrolase family protein [Myxococcales bacterium]|nr:amidohydrolase family protein [Myxococcales bacterium]